MTKIICRKQGRALTKVDDEGMTMADTKVCENCDVIFHRHPDLSNPQWGTTRFCSRTCAAKIVHNSDPVARFEENYIPEPNSGCWLWLGTLHHDGYGQIRINGKLHRAHRLAYELFRGPIPDGLGMLHACDNRACVNPDHLYAGTNIENMRDMTSRGRALVGPRNHSSKLTADNVRIIRFSALSHTELARIYGVSRPAIRNVRIGAAWGHVI